MLDKRDIFMLEQKDAVSWSETELIERSLVTFIDDFVISDQFLLLDIYTSHNFQVFFKLSELNNGLDYILKFALFDLDDLAFGKMVDWDGHL